MPIYEFSCKACGHRFDKLMKFRDPNPTCPKRTAPPERVKSVGSEEVVDVLDGSVCGGETEKLISQSSFQLKGGGWFKDGY